MERQELYEIISDEYSNWQIDPNPLGNGSYGVVYQMTMKNSDEKRALKVIPIPHDDNEIIKRRSSGFTEDEIIRDYSALKDKVLDEVLYIISLSSNANVIKIFGYREIKRKDKIGWLISFDMEYLPSLDETREFTEEEVIRIGIDICSALKGCHGKNIIHRDIKPDNILQKGNSFVLADFGESKIANKQSSLSLRGTYDYMAPELLLLKKDDSVSPYTVDIYSLGITLYLYANKNRLPFVSTIKEMLDPEIRDEANRRRLDGETLSKPCSSSDRLGRIILCACRANPKQRYQSAGEMLSDLNEIDSNIPLICDSKLDNTGLGFDHGYSRKKTQKNHFPHLSSNQSLNPKQKELIEISKGTGTIPVRRIPDTQTESNYSEKELSPETSLQKSPNLGKIISEEDNKPQKYYITKVAEKKKREKTKKKENNYSHYSAKEIIIDVFLLLLSIVLCYVFPILGIICSWKSAMCCMSHFESLDCIWVIDFIVCGLGVIWLIVGLATGLIVPL